MILQIFYAINNKRDVRTRVHGYWFYEKSCLQNETSNHGITKAKATALFKTHISIQITLRLFCKYC